MTQNRANHRNKKVTLRGKMQVINKNASHRLKTASHRPNEMQVIDRRNATTTNSSIMLT